jgi:hypothetical protein
MGFRRDADRAPEKASAPDRKRCSHCGRVKPLGAFVWLPYRNGTRRPRYSSWCRTCIRIGMAAYRQTEQARLTRRDYSEREEVGRKKREYDRQYQLRPEVRARRKLQQQSARGKLLHCWRMARSRLQAARDPERRRILTDLLATYNRELARMDQRRQGA